MKTKKPAQSNGHDAARDLRELKADFDALPLREQEQELAQMGLEELHKLVCATVLVNAEQGRYDEIR